MRATCDALPGPGRRDGAPDDTTSNSRTGDIRTDTTARTCTVTASLVASPSRARSRSVPSGEIFASNAPSAFMVVARDDGARLVHDLDGRAGEGGRRCAREPDPLAEVDRARRRREREGGRRLRRRGDG